MATLKEILRELEIIIEDLENYIETTPSDNLSSDLQKNVLSDVEGAAAELDSIIDDMEDGFYTNDEGDEFFEEEE
jgi:hypothetical protein